MVRNEKIIEAFLKVSGLLSAIPSKIINIIIPALTTSNCLLYTFSLEVCKIGKNFR